jgi:hypothetical protein
VMLDQEAPQLPQGDVRRHELPAGQHFMAAD